MSSATPSARDGALAKLAAEAARFAHGPEPSESPSERTDRIHLRPAPTPSTTTERSPNPHTPPSAPLIGAYVPVAVAPERGNTRPVVPVDGRLHMRVASQTLVDIDAVVRAWKDADPGSLRDLERATLVRIGLAMVLADVAQSGPDGCVGEAVRAALDPAVRHTDQPMPGLSRWIRRSAKED